MTDAIDLNLRRIESALARRGAFTRSRSAAQILPTENLSTTDTPRTAGFVGGKLKSQNSYASNDRTSNRETRSSGARHATKLGFWARIGRIFRLGRN
jgi:hypothetical protein